MIDREFLDAAMPDNEATLRRAEALTGLDLSTDIVERGLAWLAEFQEKDRFSGYRGERDGWSDENKHDMWWNIICASLFYKGKDSYLTAEGWPLGTRCWYVRIECGRRDFACGETMRLAVLRGLIFTAVTAARRAIDPKQRPNLHTVLREYASPSPKPPVSSPS
jgi:hypothetical protein